MATCFACKANFDPGSARGSTCSRCNQNNREWVKWQRRRVIEQGGLRGVLHFTRPHFYIPILASLVSTLMGLLMAHTFWGVIRPGFRILVVLITMAGSLLAMQYYYEERIHVLERELLREVRRGWRKGISAKAQTLMMPALGVAFIIFVMYTTIKMDELWALIGWLAYDQVPDVGNSLGRRVLSVIPFVSLVGYSVLTICFSISSTLMLARRYVKDLKDVVPQPVFLDTEKLAEIVRREAEVELGRIEPEQMNATITSFVQLEGDVRPDQLRLPPAANMPRLGEMPLPPQVDLRVQAANWVWDELERTPDGGIMMKVARQDVYAVIRDGDGSSHIPYLVRADCWGRITRIARDGDKD